MADTIVNLISRIKNRASIPAQQERFTDSYFVDLIKEELESTVIPYICGLNEEFFVIRDSITFDTYSTYPEGYLPIPRRAFARGVRQLKVSEDRYLYPVASESYLSPEQRGEGFTFENDSIRFNILTRSGSRYTQNNEWILSYFYKTPNLTLDSTISAPVVDIVQANLLTVPYTTSATTNFEVGDASKILIGQRVTMTVSGLPVEGLVYSKTATTVEIKALAGGSAITAPVGITSMKFLAGAVIYTMVGTQTNFPRSGARLYDIYKKSTGSYLKLDLTTYNMLPVATPTYDNTCFTSELGADSIKTINNNQQGGYSSLFEKELVLLPSDSNCFSPIPAEIDNFLTSCVVDRLLEALGDTEGRQNNAQIMKKLMESLTMAFGKRIQGSCKKVIPRPIRKLRRTWRS